MTFSLIIMTSSRESVRIELYLTLALTTGTCQQMKHQPISAASHCGVKICINVQFVQQRGAFHSAEW